MNNKLKNYGDFIAQSLEKRGVPFVLKEESYGVPNYHMSVTTNDVVGIFSDCTEDGSMYYAISFHKIDTFLEENFSRKMVNQVTSLVTVKNFEDFLKIISSKTAIDRLVRGLKSQLEKDLDL